MVNEVREALDLLKADPPPWRHDIEDFVAAGRRLERRRQRRRLAGSCLAAGLVTGTAFVLPSTLWSGGSREPSPVVALNAAGAAPPADSPTSSPASSAAASAAASAASSPGGSASVSLLPAGSGGSSAAGPSGRASIVAPSRPFGFTLKGYRVGRFTVGDPTAASATYQRAPVYEDGEVHRAADGDGRVASPPPSRAELVVYRTGAFVPPSLNDAQAATVGGRPARWQTFSTHVLFAWEYADGAWATLRTTQVTDHALIAALPGIAAGLVGGSETPASVPYRLSYLPAGFAPSEVAVRAHAGEQPDVHPGDGTISSAVFVNGTPAAPGRPAAPEADWRKTPGGGVLVIEVVPEKVVSSSSSKGVSSSGTVPPGRQASTDIRCDDPAALCYLLSEDGRYRVTVESTRDVTVAERLQVLQGIRLVAVDTPSTWVDARTVPGSR